MKKAIKTLIALFFFSISLLALSFSISAKTAYSVECDNADSAEAIYLYSYDSKSVLYSKNEKKLLSPASTVKIMTGLIACERLGNRLDEQITVSEEVLEGHTGVSMGLKLGASYSVRDLLYGAICGGCNDASQALAILCSDSIDEFVMDMNEYATRLDMSSTIFKNPTGLDANGAQTTIFDIAILSKAAAKNNLYMQISSAKNYTYKNADGQDTVIYNRNALISHFTATQYLNDNANGLIAGSTENGGYVVSTLARVNGMSYLCIVMGADRGGNEIYSYKIANELIANAASKFGYVKIRTKNEKVSTLPVDCVLTTNKETNISCVLEDDVYAYIPKNIDLKKRIEYRVYFHNKDLVAPINEGDVLGGLNIYLDGKLIGSARIISGSSVEENSFLIFMRDMKSFLASRYFLIFILVATPSLAIFLYFDYMKRRRKNVRYIKF